ncbi:MAG: DUF4259 domain-containing protein [Sulfitobacter sp.]|nr:DUF4259 domain-containing protein [Sulfitobacter sp.]
MGTFEDDSAQDWAQDLLESEDPMSILSAITDGRPAEEPLTIQNSTSIQCVAEMMAAVGGYPPSYLPLALEKALADGRLATIQAHLDVELVREALSRVLDGSEARTAWIASGDFERWEDSIDELLSRLRCLEA